MPLFRRKKTDGADSQFDLVGGPRLQPGRANPLVEAPPAPAAPAPTEVKQAVVPASVTSAAVAKEAPAADTPAPAATEPPPATKHIPSSQAAPAAPATPAAAATTPSSDQTLARQGLSAAVKRNGNGNGAGNGMTPVVSIRDITKIYQMGEMEVAALRGINVEVYPGEMTAIMGPSGSGKSTLMNVIGCLDVPTSGTYLLDGTDVSKLSDDQLAEIRARKIGFVFQSFNLLSRTTALANVELPLIYLGAGARKRHGRAEESLKLVGLGDRLHHKPNELSGGQQQRVAIARALINDPAMILADEPTGNLDSKTSVEIMELFQRLNVERGMTILFVTHNIETADYCHRVIHVRDGVVERDVRHEPRAGIYRDLLPENMSIHDLRPSIVGDEEVSI
jgi:putative ABC transport system ATP-binding protein